MATKTLTIPFEKSRETENTVRYYQQVGKDEPTPAIGLYMTKAVVQMLGADIADNLVITVRAEKAPAGMILDPKEAPAAKPAAAKDKPKETPKGDADKPAAAKDKPVPAAA